MKKFGEKNVEDLLALTPMQEGMLFHYLKNPENNDYFEQLILEISGKINVEIFEKAFNFVIRTNEMLRTVFRWRQVKKPVQLVLKVHNFKVNYKETEAAQEEPFDLQEIPFRVSLYKIEDTRYRMIVTNHHILYDGWSNHIILEEFFAAYEHLSKGEGLKQPVKTPYKEFIKWLQHQDKQQQRSYWQAYLEGFNPGTRLGEITGGRYWENERQGKGKRVKSIQIRLTGSLRKILEQSAAEYKLTPAVILYTAWGILLQKCTNCNDVVIGTTVSGRNAPIKGIENMVGLFINTLPFRVQDYGSETIRNMLERLQSALQERAKYESTSMVDIRRYSESDIDNELFDTLVVVENYPFTLDDRLLSGDNMLSIESYNMVEQTHYDLSVGISLFDEVDIRFIYDSSMFREDTAAALANRFISIINFILEQPGKSIYEIDILSKEEKQQLLMDFNDTAADFPLDKTLHQLFEEQVERTPGYTALAAGKDGMHLSYGELNKKSDQLVHLLRKRGVQPDTIVCIMMERSIEMVSGMLAILKAGGAYLPIDPAYPEERIKYILMDSSVKILVTSPILLEKFEKFLIVNCQLLIVNEIPPNRRRLNNPPQKANSINNYQLTINNLQLQQANIAYIIYTSGSTGMPKGVVVEHCSAVNTLTWFIHNYSLGNNTHILQMSEYTFDPSVNQVFGTLLCGGTLYLIGKEQLFDVRFLRELIKDHQIHILNSVPSFLMELLGGGPRLQSVKAVLSGSERLPETVKDAIISRGYALYNQYGLTETTIDTLAGKCSRGRVTLGKPIANVRCYVLSRVGQLLPLSVPGELYIGGAGVTRGYLNNPELTAQKFLFKSFNFYRSHKSYTSYVLYKTGDLVRWFSDGNIEYIGRIDYQVKIRGFRIEPREIENRLLSCPNVKEAVVIERESKQGDIYLCAYIVGENLVKADIKEYLSGKLPAYMIPAHIVEMEKMPLTANGKIDRAALPQPEYEGRSHDAGYAAPGNLMEERLVEVWEKVLGFEGIGIHDNFFQLGGDSIKAIQVSARLLKYDLELQINDLLLHPVIKELGKCVKKHERGRKGFQGIVKGEVPLTPIQHWLFESGFTGIHHFNHSVLLHCHDEKGLDEVILQKVFSKLVEHHDALRMVYDLKNTGVFQQCRGLEGKLFDLEVVYVMDGEIEKEIENRTRKIHQSMDLTVGPLLKSILFKTYQGDYLLMVIHHLVVDGVSWRILMEDLVTGYKQLEAANKLELPEKTDSFLYWARQLRQFDAAKSGESEYWQEVENTDADKLPRDHVIEDSQKKQKYTAAIDITLDEEQTERLLKRVNQVYNTEINDIFLTALGLAVKQWGGTEKVLVNLEGHGRESIIPGIDISRTVGWFTTQYPVVLDMRKSQDLSYAVRCVKETLRHIPGKGIGYGILKYFTPREKQHCTFQLKPEISFNYLGHFIQDNDDTFFKLSGINTGGSVHPGMQREHAVDIVGMLSEEKIRFSFLYNKYEYDKDHMESLVRGFQSHLLAIIRHCSAHKKPTATPYDLGCEISLEELERITGFAAANIDEDVEIKYIYPLSPMQNGMLYHWLKNQRDNAYFEQVVLKIGGEIDRLQLEDSVNRLVERHDILKTLFFYEGLEEPQQIVLKERTLVLYYKDISHLGEDEGRIYLEEFKEKDKERGFDLTLDMLMRFSLFKTGPGLYRLVWSFHHIIMDGWCLGIIYQELIQIYGELKEKKPANLETVIPYKSYIQWLNKQDKAKGLNYWRRYLEGFEQQTILPRVPLGTLSKDDKYRPGELTLELDNPLVSALSRVSSGYGVTMNTLFQTLWGILLQKYNNTDDVVFGSVVSGRPQEIEGVENMVGLFINTVPARITGLPGERFFQLLKRVQEEALSSRAYEYIPLVDIQSQSPLKGSLIDHIWVFENYPFHGLVENTSIKKEHGQGHVLGLDIEVVSSFQQTNYDFNVLVVPRDSNQLAVRFSYNAQVYEKEMVNRIGWHFKEIVNRVVDNLGIFIREIEVLTRAERQQILFKFNQLVEFHLEYKTIHGLFMEQVEKSPDRTAVVEEVIRVRSQYLTYRELNKKSNQLVCLLRKKRVQSSTIVGIMIERSIEMVIGMLAILKAGGAYLPIDPTYPEERINYMLADSSARVLLVLPVTEVKIEAEVEVELTAANIISEKSSSLTLTSTSPVRVSPTNPAYIIYTSGSTGVPKGVVVEHCSAVNAVTWFIRNYNLGNNTHIIQMSEYTFDPIVYQVFGTLLCGGTLYLIGKEQLFEIRFLREFIKDRQIHILNSVPFFLMELLGGGPRLDCVKAVLSGGERLPESVKDAVISRGYALYNHYGPTETTIDVLSGKCSTGSVTLGKPIANARCYVLNRVGQLVPPCVPGEIYIGGAGVARGYLNNPELTAQKFLFKSYNFYRSYMSYKSYVLYKSGDMARWLSDGNIEYIGRIDNQIKIRGFRIEPEEIVKRIETHCHIREAVVIAGEEKNGDKYLVAYLAAADKENLDLSKLRDYLAGQLPGYMVPTHFVLIDRIPLTAAGKVDRQALPGVGPQGNEDYVPPGNALEMQLVEIWADVIGAPKETMGIDANFFKLGGHSLKAIILISRIKKALDVEIRLVNIFEKPTIRELAQYIKHSKKEVQIQLQAVEKREYYSCSAAQRRMYFLQQLDKEGTGYNLSAVMTLASRQEKEKSISLFRQLIRRHESLRTSFHMLKGEPVQRILEENYKLQIINFKQSTTEKLQTSNIISEFVRPFDLAKAPLMRVELIELEEENEYILMLDMHHIITDGVSSVLLLKEFLVLYQEKDLMPLKFQYKDYSRWQGRVRQEESFLQSEAFWLEEFFPEPTILSLPYDFPRPQVQSYEGGSVRFELSVPETDALQRLALSQGATMYMVLLATFNILLARLSGQEDIVMGTPVGGRSHADLEGIIGLFVNSLALRNSPQRGKTFKEFLTEVKENTLKAFENQDYPFEELVDKIITRRETSRNPLFDVMISLENIGIGDAFQAAEGILQQSTEYGREHKTAIFDLSLDGFEGDGKLYLDMRYCAKLFKEETIVRFSRYFKEIVSVVSVSTKVKIGEMDILPDEEKQSLLFDFNDTDAKYPADKTVLQLFEEQAEKSPDNAAVIGKGQMTEDRRQTVDNITITYKRLNEKSHQLAYLLKEKGIEPGTFVGLMVERSLEMIMAILGTLKAGGAYLPIDPDYPQERINYMLKDSSASILLATEDTEDTEGVGPPTYYCCMNTPAPQEKSWNNYNVLKHSNTESTSSYSSPFLPFYTSQSSNLAYIIYTSGSTGRPRGVLVEHRNLTAYLWAFDREFCICPQDVMIQQASYAFDAFGEEVYPLLLKGGKIVITEKGDTRDVDRLSYLIILHDANIIDCSPLLLKQLNRRNILEKRKTSPYLFISGADVLKGEYVHNLLKIGTVYNTYGPTEATICTTYYRCEKEMPGGVPIGKPIANYRVYILDAGLVPVPIGAAGELCISGAGVSRGYLNNPELTAERFIFYHEGDEGLEVKKSKIFSSKKFLQGGAGGAVFTKSAPPARRRQKIYKTGDLARWLPDGNIEFIGRIDRQVQLRGFRVELEEIEKRLVSHPQVKEAAVVVKEMFKANRNLIAYVVFNQGEDVSFSQSRLREFLSQYLPAYMVPSFFIPLEALPLTPAGKIDFQSLPLPGGNIETGIPFEAPTTGIEEELLAIWQEVLGIEKIGINDHFFDLGGNSMSLLNMHEKIEQFYPARVKIVNLFTYNTIASLARFIETGDWSEESGEKVVVKENAVSGKDIAIIGMAIKIKDVETLEGFRRYLQEGVDCIGPLSLTRQRDIEVFLKAMNTDMSKVKYLEAGYLEEIDKFDYSFFRLSPREAGVLDPNQRLFLQTTWAAVEDAGYGGDRLKGTHTGVFVGHSREEEGYKKLLSLCPALPGEEMQRIPGNLDSIIPARISYLLDLKGPAVLVNTACSSALTALHQACISLRRKESTMAIVGSVKINLLPLDTGVKSEIASSDGRTRTFDDSSDGTGCGEGVIALLLKPLNQAIEDRDHIAAVIKGGAVNQDGASMGITAPNDDAQAEVITHAWQDAGIDPLTISFIEAHGTGTKLGDPIEILGLTKAFSPYTDKKQFCAVGSVKTNIGHLDHAAGLAGVVKAVLALKHKQIPPLVHFNIPNRQIDFENSPVYINKELVQWRVPGAGIPRRCGVSAFGLSGTNCHVILEEAPPQKKLPVRIVEEDQVLTLSARSPEALNALVEKYKDFLAADIDTELEDICYTANTGRGHYQYRSAFIISSKEELKQKLEIYKSPLVFYNHFKIVPLNKKIKSENEITEAELRRKSEAADRLIDQYHKNKDDKTLREILRLYVGGADVNWEKFYRKGIYYKVSLPTYPFERKRCWVEPEAGKNKDKEFTAALPGKRLVESAAHEIYSAHLSPQKHWLLGEHRVDGQAMLVGTAYLEMALQACRNIYPGSAVEIQDLVLINPLVVPDNSGREVQTVIHIKGDQLEFKVISRSLEMKSAGWTEHAAGRIIPVPASHDNQFSPGEAEMSQKLLQGSPYASWGGFLEKSPTGLVDEIKRRCPEVREAVVPDEERRQEGPVRTGPRWNSLKTIYIGEDECLANLELPGIFSSDLEEYYLYPPLVDTALHMGPALTDEPYLPLMYRKALIFASTPPCFYAHITRKYLPEVGSETVSFDITLLKTSGEIFARFEDYTLKKVRSPFPADSLYHETIWVPAVVNPGKQSGKEKTGILVLKGKSHRTAEIIKALKKNNHLVIEVIPGKGFAKIHDTLYTIDGSEGDFFKLIETVNLEENNIRQILHLGTLTGEAHGEIETPAQLEQVLQWGVYSLFYLVKALVRSRVPGFGLEILLVGETVFQVTGDEAVPRPENALLFGLAKVVPQEYLHLRCRCLDIDEQTSIETVVREIETKTGQGWFHKAYRRDLCFVEEFRTLDIRQLPDAGIKIKEKGVYMITGGLGGMGLELSKYLAEQARVKLVLLDLYENENQTGKTGELEAIEKSGSEILYFNVDAADIAGMEEVISLVQGQFGPIAGIIHCAGLPGDGFLINKDDKTFKEVLRPKVQGTWVLDRLTAACNPDFLVLCSSLTALTGAPGQGDYTAANCYLDVFSFYRNAMGRKTLTINWTAWKEVGMAAAFGPVKEEDIFVPISPGDAVQAFHQVLHKKTSRVFIGGLDLRRLDADIFGSLPFKISPTLRRGIEKQTERTGGASDTGPANREISYETVILKGKGEARENYSETEINIASIWSYALGVKEIDIYDNFYDMGGDSIIALTIVNHINRELGTGINVVDIFNHLTVEELARFIRETMAAKKEITKQSKKEQFLFIKPVKKKSYYPVSAAQKRLYILNRLDNHSTGYNLPDAHIIEGHLDIEKLEDAFTRLIERHETLRTSFALIDGQPVQSVHEENYKIQIVKYKQNTTEVEQRIKDFIRPFDLSQVPLLRVELIECPGNKFILLMDIHHIAADAFSCEILITELKMLYNGKDLPGLTIQYKDFAAWQNDRFQSGKLDKQKSFWLESLKGTIPVLALPVDFPRPQVQSFEGDLVSVFLDETLMDRVKSFARENQLTLYMILLAVYYILLHRWTGQEDIIIGSAVLGRSHPDLEKLVGMFVNILAMRNFPGSNKTGREFLAEIKTSVLNTFENQDYPFDELVEELDIQRDLSRSPLTDVEFSFMSFDKPAGKMENKTTGINIYPYKGAQKKSSKTDIALFCTESKRLAFMFEYCTALFKRETMERFATHFLNIIRRIVENPLTRLSAIDFLTDVEKENLLVRFNDTVADCPMDKRLDELFVEQAEKNPDGAAVIGRGQMADDRRQTADKIIITYQRLNEKSGRLAGVLKEKGVKPGTISAILAEPSLEMIIGILGILKAGGAYLPIDPNYPEDRIKYMLADSGSKVLLTDDDLRENLSVTSVSSVAKKTPATCNLHLQPAYIIYTSGSAGEPRGVMVEHRSAVNLCTWHNRRFSVAAADRSCKYAGVGFDASVWEIFPYLIAGTALYIVPESIKLDMEQLNVYFETHSITIAFLPTQVCEQFMKQENRSLRVLLTGGDKLKEYTRRNYRLVNNYGPTENTVVTTSFDLDMEKVYTNIPIGKPISNTRVYILSRDGHLQPVGVPGELCTAGTGTARGYLNRPDLTADRFCLRRAGGALFEKTAPPAPREASAKNFLLKWKVSYDARLTRKQMKLIKSFYGGPGGGFLEKSPLVAEGKVNLMAGKYFYMSYRTYRTGDLARWLPDGNIEFLGRLDHQIKIRGFRIELGEIEQQLLKHEPIKEAVVTVKENENGDKYLCAYIVGVSTDMVNISAELKTYLSRFLPDYMVPTYFVPIDRIPLTANGKIDVPALPGPQIEPGVASGEIVAAPDNEIEEKIQGIWSRVLGRSKTRIGIHDNFFDLGGNSLNIIHVNQQLETEFKKDIPVVMLFRYSTVHTLAGYLAADGVIIETGKEQCSVIRDRVSGDIAIIGTAGRFPGAQNPREFWNNLKNSVESIAFFSQKEILETGENSPVLTDPGYVKSGAFMQGREYFDASYFGYTHNEAQLMDPQMRIFHECTVEALEDAGYDPGSFGGAIGLYAGASSGFYWQGISFLSSRAAQLGTFAAVNLVDKDFLCTRVSYNLNLKGPALVVQTACSTSLVAVHHGCQALLNGECNIALAGGVSISAEPNRGYVYREGMIQSPDGHCRAFDADAKGTAFGDGAGIVVLKPLEKAVDDCDHIYAVIKGSAVNNDGSRKVGYTAPSIAGQAEVIRRAQQMAGIDPESITFIEAHGTGTPLGDPIEIEALKLAFNTQKSGFCAIGSVKTNIGHLDAAAGAAGLIKTVLALKYKQIPPSLHFETPNPKIDFENSPFYVLTKLKEWNGDDYPLRAGVSSFGIGGTNAHVVLEEAPVDQWVSGSAAQSVSDPASKGSKYQLIILSAKTESALEKMTENLANHLKENPGINLSDVAYTLQKGRGIHTYRRMAVCSDIDDALEILTVSKADETRLKTAVCRIEDPPIIFMFPGQGAQYVNMGRELYEKEPVFREEINRCIEILKPLTNDDIKEILYPLNRSNRSYTSYKSHKSYINRTEITQPLLVVFQYALAKLLMSWGIKPAAMIGHSIGEYTAACISGVFSLEGALNLAAERGKLMQRIPGGAMLSVPLPEEELKTLLNQNGDNYLSLAAVNSSSRCVVSGPYEAVEVFERKLKQKGYQVRRLHTSHAFHSAMMEPILAEFQQIVGRVKRNQPRVPYISNLSGSWITGQEAVDPAYWSAHLRRTVRFANGISELLKKTDAVFVEIGPGNVLSTFLKQHQVYDRKQGPPVISLVRHPREEVSDDYYFLQQMGKLWLSGSPVDWDAFHHGEKRYRITLPTYSFERHRYWNDSAPFAQSPGRTGREGLLLKKTDPGDWFYIPTWERSLLPSLTPVTSPGTNPVKPKEPPWLIFNDACGIGSRLKQLLEKENREAVIVNAGSTYSKKNQWNYTLDPGCGKDYRALFRELKRSGNIPGPIVHLWSVTGSSTEAPNLENIDKTFNRGFFSLLNIARAVGHQGIIDELQLAVISDNMQEVTGEEELAPAKAPLLAAVKIIPLEYPNIRCSSIDIAIPGICRCKETLLTNYVNQLAAEIDAGLPRPVVAFRGSHRWLENFKPFRLDRSPSPNPRLKEKGVYLITGGMGAIGMSLAKHLAEKYKARLILAGRSPFPSRDQWNDLLHTEPAAPGPNTVDISESRSNKKFYGGPGGGFSKEPPGRRRLNSTTFRTGSGPESLAGKIREIQAMENAGAEIMAVGADVSDPVRMQAVISEAQERFGRIDGVVHSAGIADYGGIIQQRTRSSIEEVMAAKIWGTLVLENLLQDTSPDFIMLFSSLGNVLYKIKFGQVGYNAANEFSEAFAPYKTRRDGVFTVTINWTDWMEKGITVNAIKRKQVGNADNLDLESLLYGGLTTVEGIDVFERVLAGPLQRVSVCTQDLDALCRQIDRE